MNDTLPELNGGREDRGERIKGVVTFSGIDKGLKLLENKGANFRAGAYTDVRILTNGVYGTIKVLELLITNM